MEHKMSQITRTEVLAKKRERYARAGKEHKTKIINELVELFGYHRNAAGHFADFSNSTSTSKSAQWKLSSRMGRILTTSVLSSR